VDTIILGDGSFGRAIAAALAERGEPATRVIGRPGPRGHDQRELAEAEVAFDASAGAAVRDNVGAVLAAGCRRIVIGTTAWQSDREAVVADLIDHDAVAVAAPNFSLGVALFGRLVDRAVELFGGVDAFDPYLVEWHRRAKADRPSGTARDLAQRIVTAHPGKTRLADPASGAPAPDELEVAVVRAGAAPGMHLVGFDAPGETIELRHTARDRSAYAAGALAAADWLIAEPRRPGLHSFDAVIDGLLERPDREVAMALAI
jgi:4-hydroxy-tetrahydrodipicolinate reductase